ncbi:hypothetical protein C8A00DRAFT_10836 [Chaetomidium leptoderma]|uniref:Uncharacterized protein n=1 Tax=Chaetomidium leptoderma TaxID=669021 RepID=A0AAN6VVU9_9PEZI|nr:hypothetical protein C8A00DRAFT_10836 [Chaetomidium leptoderma]
MAFRCRIPQRVQLPLHPSCPHTTSSSRTLTLSARLAAAKRAVRPHRTPQQQQQPPQPQPASSSSSSSHPKAQSLDAILKERKWPLIGAGLVALSAGLYISVVLTSSLHADSEEEEEPKKKKKNPPTDDPCLYPPTGRPATLLLTNDTTTTTSPAAALAFDKSLDLPERLTRIRSLRRALALRARGHVLEVAVGTGRNLAYYDWSEVVSQSQSQSQSQDENGHEEEDEEAAQRHRERLVRVLDRHRLGGPNLKALRGAGGGAGEKIGTLEGEVLSFTGVDVSGDMMGVARDRVREAVPGLGAVMRRKRAEGRGEEEGGVVPVVEALDGRVRLVLGDALKGLPSPPSLGTSSVQPTKYDTIIQTFGLCSVSDPARLLANMAAKVQPDTGRIILLEHGRGSSDWVNKKLDRSAPKHYEKYGCWWNRDIEALVREAARTVPGLEVIELERPLWFQSGTTLLIELRVRSQQSAGS